MSEEPPEDATLAVEVDPEAEGPAAFMQALRVQRNAAVGLAAVLALSVAGVVAFCLTLVRAVRLSRQL